MINFVKATEEKGIKHQFNGTDQPSLQILPPLPLLTKKYWLTDANQGSAGLKPFSKELNLGNNSHPVKVT